MIHEVKERVWYTKIQDLRTKKNSKVTKPKQKWDIRLKRGRRERSGERLMEKNTCSAQCLQCMFELWRPISVPPPSHPTTLGKEQNIGNLGQNIGNSELAKRCCSSAPLIVILCFINSWQRSGTASEVGRKGGREAGDLLIEGKMWIRLVWDERWNSAKYCFCNRSSETQLQWMLHHKQWG